MLVVSRDLPLILRKAPGAIIPATISATKCETTGGNKLPVHQRIVEKQTPTMNVERIPRRPWYKWASPNIALAAKIPKEAKCAHRSKIV